MQLSNECRVAESNEGGVGREDIVRQGLPTLRESSDKGQTRREGVGSKG
jgi:hypothetical protein